MTDPDCYVPPVDHQQRDRGLVTITRGGLDHQRIDVDETDLLVLLRPGDPEVLAIAGMLGLLDTLLPSDTDARRRAAEYVLARLEAGS